MNINFLDTSAVLNGALKNDFDEVYISPITLMELENIKTNNNKNESLQYLAREAVRDILNFQNVHVETPSQRQVNKLLKRYNFLSNINDHKIICEAILIAKKSGKPVIFMTNDATQSLFAQQTHILQVKYLANNQTNNNRSDYCGWGKYYPTEDEMVLLYSNPKMNILNC